MKKRQIINIINFIRGVEPRMEMDLIAPVKEQIRLIDRYGFSATFLIQYDALLMPEYQEILRGLDPARYEIGVWFEVVEPLCEKCGIEWTGRFPWTGTATAAFPWATPIHRKAFCWMNFSTSSKKSLDIIPGFSAPGFSIPSQRAT